MAGSGRKMVVDLQESVYKHVLYLFYYCLVGVKWVKADRWRVSRHRLRKDPLLPPNTNSSYAPYGRYRVTSAIS